jgi:two-component system, cell cycle sensor histidine kinase and response regulator CckA
MIPRFRAALRSPYLADCVALAYAAAYLVWAAVHQPGSRLNDIIADAAFAPLGLVQCWLCVRNARASARAGLDRGTRLAWSLLAASALTLWISGTAWTHFVKVTGPVGTPAWIDGLDYLQLSLTIAAALAFPARKIVTQARLRFWLDVALMAVAASVLAVHYGTGVIAPESAIPWINLVVVRAALDWGLFFTLAVGAFHKRDRRARIVLACLLGANVCVLTGNWLLSTLPVYRTGNPVDALWFVAWMVKWTGARYAWHQYRLAPGRREARDRGERRAAALPHAIVASAFLLLVYKVLSDPSGSISVFVYAAAAMGSLLVVRQVAELRDNRRLFETHLAREARFRSLVQNSSDIVLVTDDGGRVSYVSPSVARVLGEGAIQVGSDLHDLVQPGDAGGLDDVLDAKPTGGDRSEHRMRTASGEWRDIEILATDMRSDAAVAGIVLNCRDVTERNELERELHHAQKLDAVGHLAGGLAHDFNNLLTAIRGHAELLGEDAPEGSAAAADLKGIEDAVDRAAAVTRKLLAFSRRQAVQCTLLDLNRVLVDLEPLLRQLATPRVEVRTRCDARLWPIKADQGQMEQLIINLATNARDAMPEGGSLRIATGNRTITASAAHADRLPAGDYVALTVEDDGAGMTEDVRLRIFEPFFSTKPRDLGMGLGLAMVHGIVTQCRGGITVESVKDRGSTFTILIPRAQGALQADPEAPPVPGPHQALRRVLLVDDEPGVRSVVGRMLERSGYRVLQAGGGEEALAVLRREPAGVDLVLTDLVMQGMHGRELIARLRELYPRTPVVCMTGFAGEQADANRPDAVASVVLTKPFSSDVLLRVVVDALAQR